MSQHWSRPKPWETVVGTDVACMSYCYGGSAKGVERDEDAEFIAHARTDVPELVAEVKRLRAGIEHLARAAYNHTPDCDRERERGWLDWHPDCGRCWEDRLIDLLDQPTEGETNE